MKKLYLILISLNFLFASLKEQATEAMLEGNYRKAVKLWSEALRESPGDISIIYNLAVCYEYIGNVKKALALYKKCISVNPAKIKNKIKKLEETIKKQEEETKKKEMERLKIRMDSTCTTVGAFIKGEIKFTPQTKEVSSSRKGFHVKIARWIIGISLMGIFFMIIIIAGIKIRRKKKERTNVHPVWDKLSLLLKTKGTISGMYTFKENKNIGVVFLYKGSIVSAYFTTLDSGITIKGENALDLIVEMKNPDIKFIPHVKDASIVEEESEDAYTKKVVNIFEN